MSDAKLSVPHPDDASPTSGDEIAWRRELKQLRVRVAQLEQERKSRLDPSLHVKRGETHSYKCGNPCGVFVYEEQPRVECQACGTKLEPIDVLRDYARHERQFCYSLEHLRKERDELSAELKKLKTLTQRLRGKARMALPQAPARAGDKQWDRVQWQNWLVDLVLKHVDAQG